MVDVFSTSDKTYIQNNLDSILDEISELITYHGNIERDEQLKKLKNQIEKNNSQKAAKTVKKTKKVTAKRKPIVKKRAAVKKSYSVNSMPHWTSSYYNNSTTTSNSNLKSSQPINITPSPITPAPLYCYECNSSIFCPDCDECEICCCIC